ncbi:hypothetical protein IGI37_002224 [Enterococcus sp. AZ194]|uniref:helix-turn-helix domain-containing protein n=1 Tax=Enterococcus sp. AZ194 TaxID=2774629 RepID=UPI003F240CFA
MNEFDIKKIGKRIADARKALNMTQMELADKLYVSFQAVSNWERGQSIPDLERLTTLCTVFDLTLDQLIRNDAVVQPIAKLSSTVTNDFLSMRDLVDTAPFLKPQEIDSYIDKVTDFPFDQIICLAPFITETTLSFLVEKAQSQEKIQQEHFFKLAPFMNTSQFDGLVCQYLNEGGRFSSYDELLPFVKSETRIQVVHSSNRESF